MSATGCKAVVHAGVGAFEVDVMVAAVNVVVTTRTVVKGIDVLVAELVSIELLVDSSVVTGTVVVSTSVVATCPVVELAPLAPQARTTRTILMTRSSVASGFNSMLKFSVRRLEDTLKRAVCRCGSNSSCVAVSGTKDTPGTWV